MLIPRFSLQRLLIVVTICAVLALILSQAARGHAWGIAASVALAAFAAMFVLYAMAFLVAWGLGSLKARTRKHRTASPFATHTPPPQIIPPREPV